MCGRLEAVQSALQQLGRLRELSVLFVDFGHLHECVDVVRMCLQKISDCLRIVA